MADDNTSPKTIDEQQPENKVQVCTVPRDNLIATAVHFLQNPRVQGSPLSQKRAFLLKKGLTNEEIDAAVDKANNSYVQNNSTLQQQPVVSYDTVQVVPSLWSRVNNIGSTIIILGVVSYGIYRIYKLYIEPWIYGKQEEENRLSEMERQLVELNRSLSHLRRSVGAVEDTLSTQKEQLHKLCGNEANYINPEYVSNPIVLNEIKSEVASIKSLLLNRRQFPAIPNVNPTIPAWQKADMIASDDEEVTKDGHNGSQDSASCSSSCDTPKQQILLDESGDGIKANLTGAQEVTVNGETADSMEK